MPKEVRYILFTPQEVLEALSEGMALADPGWASGTGRMRLDMATATSGEVICRLVPHPPRPGGRPGWTFQAPDMLAMLLQACRRRRIPLPRRGHKRLELMGTSLCLTVTLGDASAEPEVRSHEIRYTDPALAPLLARRVSSG
ncbi:MULTISPECIES: hypothetical protein [Roseomonadaceae]|uniref:Uncharacterized protein n=1 Tax=Falsiroseomonas oleicola TaxID=2801474 RepID=A0ABS6HI10_9PROT|nr:hypothetical protein [Roseomonas oleicola]MBU8547106.1 hypothetical protein [Roseomonas oleicola]